MPQTVIKPVVLTVPAECGVIRCVMDEMEVFLEIEDRLIPVEIPNGATYDALHSEFLNLCDEDEKLKQQLALNVPLFSMLHPKIKKLVEIRKSYKFKDGDVVRVGWTPRILEDNGMACASNKTTEDNSKRIVSSPGVVMSDKSSATLKSTETSHLKTPEELLLQKITSSHGLGCFSASKQNLQQDDGAASCSTSSIQKINSQTALDNNMLGFDENEQTFIENFQIEGTDKIRGQLEVEGELDQFSEIKKFYDPDVWKKIPPAEQMVEKNRLQLHNGRAKILNLSVKPFTPSPHLLSTYGPKKGTGHKSIKKTQNPSETLSSGGNSTTTGERRTSARGKCKEGNDPSTSGCSKDPDYEPNLAQSNTDEDDQLNELDEQENQSLGKASKPKRRKIIKKRRTVNQQLSGSKSLPKFSAASLETLKEPIPNMTLVLAEIRSHIKAVTGDTYPTSEEYDNMCTALVKAYPNLGDSDNNTKSTRLRSQISASLRQSRNWENNGKPRYQHQKRSNSSVIIVDSSKASTSTNDETSSNNELLQVHNDIRHIKVLISKSYQVREMEFELACAKSNNIHAQATLCKPVWDKYPHYKDGRMVIYEYSLRIQKRQDDLNESCRELIALLQKHYKEESSNSDADVIEMLINVYKDITPAIHTNPAKKITPPLVIQDDQEARCGNSTETHTNQHSPCILVTTTDNEAGSKVLSRAFLKMFEGTASTLRDPNASEVVLLLLGSYFVSNLRYPDAYKSFMRLLEKEIHGGLSTDTARQKPHKTYDIFYKSLVPSRLKPI